MALLKGAIDEITIPVVAELDASGGKTLRVPFDVTVQVLPHDEAQTVLRSILERPDGGDPTDEALIRRYVRGWQLTAADGTPAPFTEAVITEALQIRGYREALLRAVMESLAGRKAVEAARRKN